MNNRLEGIVEQGHQQASQTFFLPTANLAHEEMPQEQGVFFAVAHLGEQTYHGLCFIGNASLLPDQPSRVEVHLFDYQGPSLYGQKIQVELLEKLRDPLEFTSKEEAHRVIAEDVVKAKMYFESKP